MVEFLRIVACTSLLLFVVVLPSPAKGTPLRVPAEQLVRRATETLIQDNVDSSFSQSVGDTAQSAELKGEEDNPIWSTLSATQISEMEALAESLAESVLAVPIKSVTSRPFEPLELPPSVFVDVLSASAELFGCFVDLPSLRIMGFVRADADTPYTPDWDDRLESKLTRTDKIETTRLAEMQAMWRELPDFFSNLPLSVAESIAEATRTNATGTFVCASKDYFWRRISHQKVPYDGIGYNTTSSIGFVRAATGEWRLRSMGASAHIADPTNPWTIREEEAKSIALNHLAQMAEADMERVKSKESKTDNLDIDTKAMLEQYLKRYQQTTKKCLRIVKRERFGEPTTSAPFVPRNLWLVTFGWGDPEWKEPVFLMRVDATAGQVLSLDRCPEEHLERLARLSETIQQGKVTIFE